MVNFGTRDSITKFVSMVYTTTWTTDDRSGWLVKLDLGTHTRSEE